MTRRQGRPVFLNLLRIRQPVMAITSIGHRLTGVLLFLLLPFGLSLLELSLRDPAGFDRARTILATWPMRLLAVLAVWWFAHHLFAGIRLLFLDLGRGSDLATSRRSAWSVNLAGIAVLGLALVAAL